MIAAIEGAFQGGSLGEVGGAKIAGALELAVEDNRQGIPTGAVLLLETGGVRLQEANLGLAAIAEIQAAIVALRQHQPVVGVIAGAVGCFGGMSIAAGLCSHLLVTREARLGLNGPQVIEQEAGIEEYDARDRPFIWSLTGGEQRHACGLADAYVADDVAALREALAGLLAAGEPAAPRCRRPDEFLARLARLARLGRTVTNWTPPRCARSTRESCNEPRTELAARPGRRHPAGGPPRFGAGDRR